MEQNFENFSIQQALELMKSPEGRQLISLLRRSGGERLNRAVQQASGGDYTQARELITEFLASPEGKNFLQKKG